LVTYLTGMTKKRKRNKKTEAKEEPNAAIYTVRGYKQDWSPDKEAERLKEIRMSYKRMIMQQNPPKLNETFEPNFLSGGINAPLSKLKKKSGSHSDKSDS